MDATLFLADLEAKPASLRGLADALARGNPWRERVAMQPPMLLLGMAGFFNDFVMPAAWAGCMDIGGRHSGTVSGTMNMIGNIGGALSPMLVGYILTWSPDTWALTFYGSSGIYLLGGVCWLFIDACTPLEELSVHP